jgi:hypothetical protein
MTAEYAESSPILPAAPTLHLTVVEGDDAAIILTPLERFQLRPRIRALEDVLEQGRFGVAPAFNGSLMDFVQQEAAGMRTREPFGTPEQPSQSIGHTALSYLPAFYHELRQQGNDEARAHHRDEKLQEFGRVAIRHYMDYPEVFITNHLVAEYKAAGKHRVVRAIGDVMIAYGQVLESLRSQAEGYPEPAEE